MTKNLETTRERGPSPPSLLIAAHCSTIRRKSKRIDIKELSAILDDLVREFSWNKFRSETYLHSLNEIVKSLNASFPPTLLEIRSHSFFILVRNTIRNLLHQLSTNYQLAVEEIYTLRNCILFLSQFVKETTDVSTILHWITELTFLDALANCLKNIKKILKLNKNKLFIKQITRLLNLFCHIQERLPIHLHQTFFVPLLQPTLDCLTSSNYVKCFKDLQINANSLTPKEKLFLIKCPYFLTTYNGPHIEKAIEQVLAIKLPRYVSILDEHMTTIKQWNRPIMRAIHNLLITIIYAEGYLSSHTTNQSFRSLIDHLLRILSEPRLINNIRSDSHNMETLIIDATLLVFSVLVYESDALDYIKQCKPVKIFRQLTTTPSKTIVLNAHMMLAYTMDENDVQSIQDGSSQSLSMTLNLLKKAIEVRHQTTVDENVNQEHIDRNIIQLVETLKGLIHHDQIRKEILKRKTLPVLIEYYQKLKGLSKQLILECLWTLSFDEQIAQQLREHSQFILTLENIPKSDGDNTQQNVIRRTNSYSSRRNSIATAIDEVDSDGIRKVADGLLWKLVKEPQFREKIAATDNRNFKYDMMISYCYADREIVYEIQQFLANEGFNIWFDRNKIHEQAMEIVADAIENAEFVIVCMSDSYKRDNHCQAETAYAINSKRLLLPLVVRKGYKPDGWLSSIAINSTFIDFGATDFNAASTLLMKEIKQQRKKEVLDVKPRSSTPVTPADTSSDQQAVSSKPYVPSEFSTSIETTSSASVAVNAQRQQQQMSARSVSKSPARVTDHSAASVLADRQQQQASVHPVLQLSTQGFVSSPGSVVLGEQQHTASAHPVALPSTPGILPPAASTIVDKQAQQQIPARSISRTPTPGSITSINIDKQQQQMSVRTISRPSTPGAVPSSTSAIDVKQQQTQTPLQPALQQPTHSTVLPATPSIVDKQHQQMNVNRGLSLPTPSSVSSDVSINIGKHQQQTLAQPALRPKIISNGPSTVSATAVQQQQTQTPVQPALQRPTYSTVLPAPPIIVDKQDQQINVNRTLRSPTPSPVFSDVSVNIGKHQQQTLVQPILRPGIIDNGPLAVSATAVHQQQTQTSIQPALQRPTYSTVLHAPPYVVDKQHQQISVDRAIRSPALSSISSDASINTSKHQQQTLPQPILQPEIIDNGPSVVSTTAVKQQQTQTPMQTALQRPTYSTDVPAPPPVIDKQHQQINVNRAIRSPAFNSISSDTSINTGKYQQQTLPQPVSGSTKVSNGLIATSVVTNSQQQTSVHSPSPFVTSGHSDSLTFVKVNTEQQHTSVHPVSQPSMNGSISSAIPVGIDKQQQQIPARSNPRPTMSGILPDVTPVDSVLPAPSLANISDHSRLPQKYTNHNTSNSTYHTIPVNAWRKNDVLDFLFDSNLDAMMPLCESMAGKAFIRFFRMCQEKSIRLYSQLNEELRVRFNGLSLPMGVYTQFLTEMDALVGPTLETHPSVSPPRLDTVKRVVITPRTVQQQQPTSSTTSTSPLKIMTPVKATSRTTTPHNIRITERAVFRPASSTDRLYSFIVESVEESTEELEQVGHNRPQFLSLDETARQHREINSLR